MGFDMAITARQLEEALASPSPRSSAPPPRDTVLNRDVISLCARQSHLNELAFRLADHGHTHVGDVIALSRYTLIDLADGETALVDSLELVLGHLGLQLETPAAGWTAPPGDTIDALLD
ncbi:hypothetical protein [Maricaulis sp.]|uniref:hypothetical protein n=1 Tax=Maricaulis sp. TaxID=1486257 RepID=UPI002B26E8E2|nr:hypothetical protein [Maricaulis sp.]